MAGRDDGEFELILGNKQLLSVLFIVIVLLGVFFAMGFLAGRTTGASPVVAQTNAPERQPLAVDSASGKPPMISDEKQDATPAKQADVIPPMAEPRHEPKPESKADSKKDAKAESRTPPKKAEEPPPAKPTPARSARAEAGGYIATPPTGSYLQAAATRRADAEAMLAGIRSKTGLGGYVTPSPKSAELLRVIVGPLTSKSQQAEARVKLAEMGVKNPFLVNY